jgi:hypothetical protein
MVYAHSASSFVKSHMRIMGCLLLVLPVRDAFL